jgi:hypothetical protein
MSNKPAQDDKKHAQHKLNMQSDMHHTKKTQNTKKASDHPRTQSKNYQRPNKTQRECRITKIETCNRSESKQMKQTKK